MRKHAVRDYKSWRSFWFWHYLQHLIDHSNPRVTIAPADGKLILTWPTSTSGFVLQSATNLFSPSWTPVSAAPVVANGQYTVTNPISGTQQFFRLSQ